MIVSFSSLDVDVPLGVASVKPVPIPGPWSPVHVAVIVPFMIVKFVNAEVAEPESAYVRPVPIPAPALPSHVAVIVPFMIVRFSSLDVELAEPDDTYV
jgi:hypothetical protein